jgi:hypothetical protein
MGDFWILGANTIILDTNSVKITFAVLTTVTSGLTGKK